MKPKIFVISGPSGCGKGTIIEALTKDSPDLAWPKSYTTRPKRESDKSENHYIFVDEPKFKELEKTGEIFESNFYNDNWYGSSKSEIEKLIDDGRTVIKEVDVNGGEAYRKTFPDAVLIFITTSLDNIKARLISRGQNTDEEIAERLAIARRELEYKLKYDFVVENPEGHPEKAVGEIEKIIGEKNR